eukprot:GSMAST32.ASY1.ANO1.2367.1 assembled CDS
MSTAQTRSPPVENKHGEGEKKKKRKKSSLSSSKKRLMKDFKKLQRDPPSGISGAPVDSNIMVWQAVIFGPDETSWEGGTICLDILKSQWSPIYDISAILTSIQSLLSDPNPKSPANSEAARLYEENRREYVSFIFFQFLILFFFHTKFRT